MKHIKILSALLILMSNFTFAQKTEIGIGFSGYFATKRPANIDVTSSGGVNLNISRNFDIKNNWQIQPTLQLGSVSYIMDGGFDKQNGEYTFGLTPANHKQDVFKYYSIKLPVLLKYGISENNSKPFAFIGIGPYFEYMINPTQSYKIGIESHTMRPPIQNKLNYGFAAELSLYSKLTNKTPFSFNAGFTYQISDYLTNASSFKPFAPYLRIGIGF